MGRRSWARRVFASCLLAAVFLCAGASAVLTAPPAALAGPTLRATLDGILVRSQMAGAGSAVEVWDLDTGKRLYARNAHVPLTPASNEKLVTSAAALDLWGPDKRFRTEIYVTAPPDADGVVCGDVVLKGYGDPTLASSEFARFAAALRAAGVRRVKGRVAGDESHFDTLRTVSGWKTSFQFECGPLSALAVDGGWAKGRRVAQPAVHAARLLRASLVKAGVEVEGGAFSKRLPARAILVYTDTSPRVAVILSRMNKTSDNFIAEMLTKGIGRDAAGSGTTRAGVAVQRRFLLRCGVPARECCLRDGSGLCYANRLTASAVSRLLRVVHENSDDDVLRRSLPVAGVDGTLRLRMRGTPAQRNVRAKTGTLSIASCLSGYVSSADHHSLAFSILMNRASLNVYAAQRAQDEIGAALARLRL